MLNLAVMFLLVAVVAAIFGFTTIAGPAWAGAKILFFVFLIMFVVSAIMGYGWKRTPV
jgi:uncharacterized membrane protein YtjA (UPF0391 family)